MFPSLTNKFKEIECPALLRKEKCDVINCVFKHPDEVAALQRKIRSSSESYINHFQNFYNQPSHHSQVQSDPNGFNGSNGAVSPPMTETDFPPPPRHPAPALPEPVPKVASQSTPSAGAKKPLFNQDRLRQIKMSSPEEEEPLKPQPAQISPPKITSSNTTPLTKNRFANSPSVPSNTNENNQPKRKSRFSSSPDDVKKSRLEVEKNGDSLMEKNDSKSKESIFKIVPRVPNQPKNSSEGKDSPSSSQKAKLSPQTVNPFPPSTTSERLKFLKEFYNLFKKQNQSEQDCIEMAVAAEYEIASSTNSSTYMNTVKQSIFKLRKSASDGDDYNIDSQYVATEKKDDWLAELQKNTVSRQNLLRNGYVMEVPQAPQDSEGFLPEHDSESNEDVKICAHCGNKFLRSEQMKRKNKCRYHPAKVSILKLNENLKNGNAYNSKVLSCCHQPVDEADEGCRRLPHHVFKCETPWEMQEEIPFVSTKELCENAPESTKKMKKLKAVGLDCEMGFTSKGFEVIRLTIVDYVSEKEILNHIVKPQGKIIDLNTDYSGVADIPETAMPFDSLRLVWSGLIGEDTILIGHGLENDMNVLRIIHNNIIDTAIKYSENTIDPKRKDGLKKLALKYLGKTIQQGQHDSLEDSVIAIQIVKERIAKRSSI